MKTGRRAIKSTGVRYHLRMREPLWVALKTQAGHRGVPIADVVRFCLEKGLFFDGAIGSSSDKQKELSFVALFETRQLLRELIGARDPQALVRAQEVARVEVLDLTKGAQA